MPSPAPAVAGECVASAIARLVAEFGGWPALIESVVIDCRRELAGSPPRALPELVERLARQRLLQRRDATDR